MVFQLIARVGDRYREGDPPPWLMQIIDRSHGNLTNHICHVDAIPAFVTLPEERSARRQVGNTCSATAIESADECYRDFAVTQFEPCHRRSHSELRRELECDDFDALDRLRVSRRGEPGDPELSIALDIGFREYDTE